MWFWIQQNNDLFNLLRAFLAKIDLMKGLLNFYKIAFLQFSLSCFCKRFF